MGLIEQLDIKEINRVYLFANTPKYLYRHLRQVQSVQELSRYASLRNIVDAYNEITSPTVKSSEDIAIAYALLVTVTFWEYQQGVAAFDEFDLSRLEWGNDMKDIFEKSVPINTIVRIHAKANILSNELMVSGSSTSTVSYEYTHKKRNGGKT